MPALPWWAQLLVGLALKYGPVWLLQAFPKLPDWLKQVVNDLAKELSAATTPAEKKAARKKAAKICKGVGCPTEIKRSE